jgi:hypothetical protein
MKDHFRQGEVVKRYYSVLYVLKLHDKQSTAELRFRSNTPIFTRIREKRFDFEKVNEN